MVGSSLRVYLLVVERGGAEYQCVSISSAAAVRATALSTALLSAVTLVLSGRAGHPMSVNTINLSVMAGGAAGMALLLHSRTPENNLWRVLLVIAVVGPLAVAAFAVALTAVRRPPEAVVGALWLVDPLLVVPWMLFIGLFPDGHRPVRRWRELVWAGALLTTIASITAWLTAPQDSKYPVPGHFPGDEVVPLDGTLYAAASLAASALTGVLPLVAAWCLLYRYRRAGPVMQQQIRVGAAGLVTAVLIEVGLRTFPFVDDRPLQFAAAVVAVGVGALGVAAALLRWRLWIVDQALPRAVVLSTCSAAFTSVLVAGATIYTGRVKTSQVRVAVFAAVIVTILVQGYSRRLEPWVRRLVYGEQPGGFAVLIGLADDLATLDSPSAAVRIADSARRALAVPWAAFWAPTARPSVFRLAATSGELQAPAVVDLSQREPARDHPATRLVPDDEPRAPFPEDTEALSLLSTGGECWGLLAVGQRRGEPLTDGDIELLTVITREAELAHANRQLLDEVADSLEQLQTRARELQESRQRLVVAQDEERRRIERDLHDGAQHELVTLAGQLRGMARSQTFAPGALDDLAERAERAVFSLQDLARGIYPSVLTDRGVAAAIRSYAGRLPIDVTLEAEGATGRRRWSDDLEGARYIVAVESLGNCLKHATATATTGTLAEQERDVVLEVHDNGSGFDPNTARRGSGLQHMTDRMSALGGTLVVNSRRGEGTWVTARVPACVPGLPTTSGQRSVPDSRK
jgi:signal transduction histidine kinase